MMVAKREKTGLIALIGKTNVGKSTLINEILQHKISITSRKPQTTRHRLLGIKTSEENQFIFMDTPIRVYGSYAPSLISTVEPEGLKNQTVHNTLGKNSISFNTVLNKVKELLL